MESSQTNLPPRPAAAIDYGTGAAIGSSSLVRIGGALGIAASCIGLAIVLLACAGFNAAMYLSILPLILAGPGLVLTIIGGVMKDRAVEDTHVLSALFVNIVGIIGGLFEVAVWLGWHVFYQSGP